MDVLRIFNLQLFAEDDFEDNQIDSDVVADETVDDETVDDVDNNENDEISIPEEFEGLDPEIAREFTNKFREQQKAEDEKLESKKELLPVISFRIKQSNRFISQKSKNPLNYHHNMNITILIKHHVLYKAQFIHRRSKIF